MNTFRLRHVDFLIIDYCERLCKFVTISSIIQMRDKSISVSIGVMAHNEAKNITQFLDSLLAQKDFHKLVSEVIIVSSGSTDGTNTVISRYQKQSKKIHLIKQAKRNGKATAVNCFIATAKNEILVLVNADLILEQHALKTLLIPFKRKDVGIVGSHPVPVNNEQTFMGFAAHLQWEIHHQISLSQPKMGEMIAFRKIFKQIPSSSSVDEANIEPLIRGQGYKAAYAPKAIVYNKGPEKISEFLARRRHIYYGHIVTKHLYSYEVSTLRFFLALSALMKSIKPTPRYLLYTPLVILLEATGRILGFIDYKLKIKTHTVWDVTHSTKNLSTTR